MNYRKGSASTWAIIILVIVIIAGAAYWYLTQGSAQPTTSPTTQALQATEQNQTTPTQPATQNVQQTNTAPASNPTPASQPAQPVTVQNQNGQMTATPTTVNTWQFSFNGPFAEQQQSYVLDYGDGTQVSVQCETPATNGQPVCNQLAPLTHTYTSSGTHQVKFEETFVGAGPGNEQVSTLLSLSVTN